MKSKLTEKLSKNKNGELVGIYHNVYMDDSLAGDVNDDSMVDLIDLLKAEKSYGDKKVSVKDGDVNQDGIVNETDIRYIEKNFLKKGPDAKKNQKPVESMGTATLKTILRSIGLEPKS